jgi:hypothetical protein
MNLGSDHYDLGTTMSPCADGEQSIQRLKYYRRESAHSATDALCLRAWVLPMRFATRQTHQTIERAEAVPSPIPPVLFTRTHWLFW